ncbi:MAG: imidazolonepropionase, partial [Bacteroidota bacterium]
MQSIDYNGSNYQLIGPFKQILTMQDLPIKGPLDDHQLMMARDFGILVKDGFIHEVGNYSDLTNFAKLVEANVIYLEEDYVCLPGFIDSHTHICFEGSRARDYALRNTGKTYLEIAASGGGIWDTVTQVRRSSSEKLEASLFKRASRHLIDGITTIEVKSGYGLSVQSELKMLEAIRSVNTKHKVDLVSTCLAAHTLPKDFDEGHQDYLRQVEEELLPKLIHRDLT